MIFFIDFDGTVCPDGDPQPECREVLKKLKEDNHTIVMYSCRSNPSCVFDHEQATKEMIEYLKKHDIPFDGIEPNKPFFNFIIDDRALGIPLTKAGDVDWAKIKTLI
jgi:hypothetical protein